MILRTIQLRIVIVFLEKENVKMISKVNLRDEVNAVKDLYVYQKIGYLNKHILSVVQVEDRTLDFHVHEASDEMFFVIEGTFQLETEEGLLRVNEGEFVIVPKGTKHRPVVNSLAKFLMVELEGTLNKENSGDLYEE